ncbi:unnamed protein product, partial [Musa acuminata subsp. burmannicoides]
QVDSSDENLVKVEGRSFELLLCFLIPRKLKLIAMTKLFLGAVTGTSLNSLHPT